MQPRFTRAQRRFRFGPNLRLDTAAADRPRDFAVLKEKHFRTALLRSRATRMRDGSHYDALATVVGLVNQTIQITLRDSRHGTLCFFVRVFCWRVYVTAIKVQSSSPQSSLRNLCVLCASAVCGFFYRRDAEDAEITQRQFQSGPLCTCSK